MTEEETIVNRIKKACMDSGGTAALSEHVLHMVLPLVSKSVSRSLIEDPGTTVLLNEEKLKGGEKADVTSNISLAIAKINIVDSKTLQQDMEKHPIFEWPEKDCHEDLMNRDSLTVLDVDDLTLKIVLGKGVEFSVPVVNLFGKPVTLEVGCGGDEEQNCVHTHVLMAFMGRPNLTPNVHINADCGKGDFFEMDLTDTGSLDDVVENVLMGFGPTECYEQHKEEEVKEEQDQSWAGNALGKQLSKALGKFADMGNNKPYELDLTESITQSFSGKPCQVKDIQADADRLQLVMEEAKNYCAEHPEEVIKAEEKQDEEDDNNS